MRAFLNRLRRWLWRQLFFRMVFGEQGRAGPYLPQTRIAPSTCIEGEAGLELADHVFIGQFNFLDATAGLRIGEGVQITNFVSIVTHSSHRSIRLLGRAYASYEGTAPGYVRSPIVIGAYSFIGPHSVVEAGSHIGKGVVVCAHSRIRGHVPDFAILAGSPARVIGDVRLGDAQLLERHPELASHYAAWAGELPLAEPVHG
ncbi:acyltransferase [Acidovorax sp. Root402]|jgi:acetyltransferase-like isoleucine patch superfamily enzyme|uniref:acyltransferase n=1 Tax=Acidovorax sp. Root402 TaxID=1736527 RepID=UPI0006F840FF|nr:acyltransferase [Acidovorax sp. Root402]KQW26014.1 acetyltransferase [Acidovorax sp. Root402]